MAVGAGSIKRASKLNAAAEENVKKDAAPVAEVAVVSEEVKAVEAKAEEVKAEAPKKPAAKKTPAKKPAAKKSVAPKKTAAKTAIPKAEAEKPVEVAKPAVPQQKQIGNVACHLTEELPIHLL